MSAVHLIDVDPDLGRHLTNSRLLSARRELVADVIRLKRGQADLQEEAPGGVPGVGLLILEGLLERDVMVGDTISAELLGPGDVIRDRSNGDGLPMLGVTVTWDVLADARFAVLDERVGRSLQRYPEINAVVLDRLVERVHRLSIAQAISQLNGVDRRLLALFWHLGERWGRIAADGLLVPLDLPHRVLAQLVGARRPTVSTAMRRLAERGELRRRADGAWVVDRASAAQWAPHATRPVAPRRLRLVEPAADEAIEAPAAGRRIEQLRPSVIAMEKKTLECMQSLRGVLEQAAELRRRHSEWRERVAAIGGGRERGGDLAERLGDRAPVG